MPKAEDFNYISLDGRVFTEAVQGITYPKPPIRDGVEIALILDIGTHLGGSAIWLNQLFPAARMVCFEPNSECELDLPFAEVRREAFLPRSYRGRSVAMAWDTHLAQAGVHGHGSIPVCTVDDLSIDPRKQWLLKIDSEGRESEVFGEFLASGDSPAVAYLETHNRHDTRDVLRLAYDRGYWPFSLRMSYSPNRCEIGLIRNDCWDDESRHHIELPSL
jgi:hypothetical protein